MRTSPRRASRFDGFDDRRSHAGPARDSDPFLSPAYAVYQPATFTDVDGYVGYRLAPQLVLALRGYNLGNDRYALYAGFRCPDAPFAVELRSR